MHGGRGTRRDRGSWRAALAATVVVGSVAAGCSAHERTAPWADEALADECTPPRREGPRPVITTPVTAPITTLVTRDHEVAVYAGVDGLRFSVALADGSVLGRMLTPAEFALHFPALHRRFDAAFAGDERWLDASLDGLPEPTLEPTLEPTFDRMAGPAVGSVRRR